MVIMSVMYLVVGFLVSFLYSGIRTLLVGIFPASLGVWSFFLVWVAGLVIVLPLSFLAGLLVAALYNMTSGWWGGLRIDLVRSETPPNEDKMPDAASLKK